MWRVILELLIFNHDWFSNYIKGYLIFSNSKNVVNITLQFRYYGSSDSNFKFLFYSRCVKGVQKSGFDHRIFNLKSTDFAGHILYFEPINMNNEKIINIGNPTDNKDVVNKEYVDDQIANVNIDTTPLLPRDGSRKMTGDLDLNNNRINSCGRLTMNNDTVSPIEMYGSKILNCGGLTMNNDLNSPISMNNNRIYNLPNPTGGQQPVPLVFGDNRYLKLDGSKAMTSNLNMGDHVITGIRSSSMDNAALTVGGAKATYLPLLGDRSMQGNLNMSGFTIRNIRPFVEDDSSQAASDAQKNDVINYGYFHTQRGELKQLINQVGYDALNRKNPDQMEDNIDMNNHQIKGLSDGNENDDAANVRQLNELEDNVSKYIDKKITETNTNINSIVDQKIKESEEKSIISIEGENVFKKVMDDDLFKEDDDDIHKNGVVNKSYHKVNQKTYEFKIDYDSSIGYYSTRLSIDVIYLPIGSYTMVYEMYVDDGITVSQIEASSGNLSVIKTASKINGINTRSVIQFRKHIIHPSFDDLDIDIQLKSKNDPQTTIYVVVYGITGIHSDVSIQVWDRLYYYENDSLNYEVPIDMKDKDITNVNKITTKDLDVNGKIDMKGNNIIRVGDGINDEDAVNKAQLNTLRLILSTHMSELMVKLTKYGHYYFTNVLKHNNQSTVKFPAVNKHPYSANDNSEYFRITLDGNYQIIYTDNFKNCREFIIHDQTNGIDLFKSNIVVSSDFEPININAVIPINVDNGFNHVDIKLYVKNNSATPNLDGVKNSTFFIKYLGD